MSSASTKTILSRVLFLLYICAVCLVCFTTSSSLPSIQKTIFGIESDKLIHFIMFAPFPILSYLSFDHPAKKPGKSILFVFLTMLAGAFIAIATEVVQYYLPTRAMDINDFYADTLAVVTVSIFVLITDLTRKK